MRCKNCRKKISNYDTVCYSKIVCEYFCSLDCFADFAHEYLHCVPIGDDD